MHLFHSLALIAGLFAAIGISGCASSSEPETPATPQQQATSAPEEGHEEGQHEAQEEAHEEGQHEAHEAESASDNGSGSKVDSHLAKLSDADRAAVKKQKVCPVSGDTLGAMNAPVKITVKGQEVWLCCPNCEKKIKSDPDTYLAKLKK